MNNEELKQEVYRYWNKQSCGTDVAEAEKFSKDYFDEIEQYRYSVEPEIFSFAQFSRYRGKKMLEVGVGAGTDFLQWVRSGTLAHGIDLTQEGVDHVKNRLKVYGLSAEDVKVGDAENIPYPNNSFDLVYSWGVIHHTPNTIKALEEIIRVTKIGGEIKIMIYNRHSLYSFYRYLYHGLFKGRPFRTISSILYHHLESLGTKAYTLAEVKKILARYPVEVKSLTANVTNYDLLWNRNTFLKTAAQVLAGIYGLHRCGWFLTFELKKISEIKNKLGE